VHGHRFARGSPVGEPLTQPLEHLVSCSLFLACATGIHIPPSPRRHDGLPFRVRFHLGSGCPHPLARAVGRIGNPSHQNPLASPVSPPSSAPKFEVCPCPFEALSKPGCVVVLITARTLRALGALNVKVPPPPFPPRSCGTEMVNTVPCRSCRCGVLKRSSRN